MGKLQHVSTVFAKANEPQATLAKRDRRTWLEELKAKHSLIGDVRGMELMQAIELVEDRESKTPATVATAAPMEAARENRLLMGKGAMQGNLIRISPR